MEFTIEGNIVDVANSRIYPGEVLVEGGRIAKIRPTFRGFHTFILPPFIDAHIHVESSLLVPSSFARLAVAHGTLAVVSDPHEIANVLGVRGVDYMIEDGIRVPFRFFFGAPSCVPASRFETSGSRIGAIEVENLLRRGDVWFLSEVMDYPGVIGGDPEVMAKIEVGRRLGKPIDGHAPGLTGEALRRYVGAGITTDHECMTLDEALEKLALGVKILIREGSSACNLDALSCLIERYPDMCMLCSDDRSPHHLAKGHVDELLARVVGSGVDPMKAIRAATLNPARHYGLPVGLLREGDPADFVVVGDLRDFHVIESYLGGRRIACEGEATFDVPSAQVVNNFVARPTVSSQFAVRGRGVANVICAEDGSIVTGRAREVPSFEGGFAVSDPTRDILKIAVLCRYMDAPPSIGFAKGFGIKRGAIASSISHDSHNVVVVGVTDEDLSRAANLVIEHRGGIAAVCGNMEAVLPLPIAGLMSDGDPIEVARRYEAMEEMARGMGSSLRAPFMTLSFMSLLVVPSLKLSDRGLFDAEGFRFIELFEGG
ncbi:MAG: adenine deaminase [Candidatus Caldarchaeum sp.]